MDQIKIGNYKKAKRQALNLTQEELTEKLNVSSKSISLWENGKTFPDLSLYYPLCSALNMSLIEFLNGEDIASDSSEKETNMFILRLLFSKKQATILKFLMSLIFDIGIGLLSYSFSDSLDSTQKVAFTACGLIISATITFIRIKIFDKIP